MTGYAAKAARNAKENRTDHTQRAVCAASTGVDSEEAEGIMAAEKGMKAWMRDNRTALL
jgi:hypothetical protein